MPQDPPFVEAHDVHHQVQITAQIVTRTALAQRTALDADGRIALHQPGPSVAERDRIAFHASVKFNFYRSVAKVLGISKRLPEDLKIKIAEGALCPGVAYEISKLDDPNEMRVQAVQPIENGLK